MKVGINLQNSLFQELLIYHKMIHLLDTTAKPMFTTPTFTVGTVSRENNISQKQCTLKPNSTNKVSH